MTISKQNLHITNFHLINTFIVLYALQDCNNFQAGNVLRNKSQITHLNYSGVFGSCCQHEIPVMFVNLRHGQR